MNLSTYHPWNILKYYSASFRGCVSMVQWLCPYLQSFNPPGIQCDSCKTLLYVIYEYDIYIYRVLFLFVGWHIPIPWPSIDHQKNDGHALLFAGTIPTSNHFYGYNLMVVMRKLRFDFDVSRNLSVITSSNLDHTPA
jgi:hypothetical protein